ncbi:heme lyase CcmF/NrfE family subunit [Biformimicrobium ophioploci]|uniref:Heme lyase CcmF/NrfE family subunit n=1 Tax=Biformimicrobium ophioploci TaxID=3036711 RepID=A0ABQ6M003_9GAMM|nr:heme lyase CcmF/NrfE family subunit [Microbulbifer sp. NKW57]GMG87653.1 heme lyase CcmF/NrfE family subunit [Microbulbifer sp. NKW57]
MIPEIGQFALILGLLLSLVMAVVPMVGAARSDIAMMRSGHSLAYGVLVLTIIAYACLTIAFVQSDFSVAYVAQNSNSVLPVQYKVAAVWGGHEGSMLLWVLMMCGWTAAVARFSRALPPALIARVLSVLGMILVGLFLFMLFTSNPFDRILPFSPTEGSDLNPLLQDPGMIFHPPLLYMGYVGFSVAFAFSIAALIGGHLDSSWARWTRPWTIVAWAFLSLGIALGSWWAYYELGWGGWWFWDPVENASFMPWLAGTALIHSLAVTEKRGLFKSWTILLAIFTFALSLLGTFLVRSGVLVSVHAFATDPARGSFILGFLVLVVGGSLLLYALRAPAVHNRVLFSWLSREAFLLWNNVVLVIVLAVVLLGTLYPLIADALNLGRVSVGPPYFNFFFVPLMGVLCVLLGLGISANWKKTPKDRLLKLWLKPQVLALVVALAFPFLFDGQFDWKAALAVYVASWVLFASLADWYTKTGNARTFGGRFGKVRASYYGMLLAHIGLAITAAGVTLNTIYSVERDVRMLPGDVQAIGHYEFRFDGVERVRGPNYMAVEGRVLVSHGGSEIGVLKPQKRNYFSGGNTMTEAAIDTDLFRDVFIALGDNMGKGAWSVRLQYKPFVVWIWLGALFMGIGGGVAVADKRYRRARAKAPVQAAPVLQSA